jgi:hypothetical protein
VGFASGYSADILQDSPVSWWRLNETSPVCRVATDQQGTSPANLCLNPSFEALDAAGWTTASGNTITPSTAQAKYGAVSLQATYQSDLRLAWYATNPVTTTVPGTTYVLACWVYIPSGWTGGAIQLTNDFNVSPTVVTSNSVSAVNAWTQVFYVFTATHANSLGLFVRAASAPTAGQFIYVDGAMILANTAAVPTTYYGGTSANDGDYQGSFETNVITNPLSAGSLIGTNGWSTAATAHISAGATLSTSSSGGPFTGGGYVQVTTTSAAANEGMQYGGALTLTGGVTYQFSMYVEGNAGGELMSLICGSVAGTSATTNITLTTGWARYSVAYTPASTVTDGYVLVRTQGATAYVVKCGCAQLVANPTLPDFSPTVSVSLAGLTPPVASLSGDPAAAAVTLDGWRGRVTVVNSGLPTLPVTLEAWYYFGAASTTNQIIISKESSGVSAPWQLYINPSGQLAVAVGNGTTQTVVTAGSVLSLNAWHHVVASVTTTTATLYADGVQVGSASVAGQAVADAGADLGLGAQAPSYTLVGFPANASISDVAIYATALSAARVQAHYAAGLAGITYSVVPSGRLWQVVDNITGVAVATYDDANLAWDAKAQIERNAATAGNSVP